MSLRHISVYLRGLLVGTAPVVLDHVSVPTPALDWRDEAVRAAQLRYGKPFKCGAATIPREVQRKEGMVVADSQEIPPVAPKAAIVVEFRNQSKRENS
jgi:hypothetical protein